MIYFFMSRVMLG